MGYLRHIIKQANTTYSYSAATSRNFTPAKVNQPIKVNADTGVKTFDVKQPQHQLEGLPRKGTNKPAGPWYSEFSFLHPFTPTVSGTGSGHKYWEEPKNPFDV